VMLEQREAQQSRINSSSFRIEEVSLLIKKELSVERR